MLGQSRGDADGRGRRRQTCGGVGVIASQGWLAIFPAGSRHSPKSGPARRPWSRLETYGTFQEKGSLGVRMKYVSRFVG